MRNTQSECSPQLPVFVAVFPRKKRLHQLWCSLKNFPRKNLGKIVSVIVNKGFFLLWLIDFTTILFPKQGIQHDVKG